MEHLTTDPATPAIRSLAASRGSAWIGEAFDLFRRAPGTWIGIVLAWLVLMIVLSVLPLGSLLTTLIGPVFTAGMMLGCAAQQGQSGLSFQHLFAGFRSPQLGQLLLLGLIYLLLTAAIFLIAGGGLLLVIFSRGHIDLDAMPVEQLMLSVLVVLALSVPLMMATWFAPALIVLRSFRAVPALRTSFLACLRNLVPFLIYGLLALVIAILAAVPLGLGYLVALPVFVASIYTSYVDVFGVQEPARG